MYKNFFLKNKLKILLVPMKESQTTTVLVLVKTGSKYETKEKNGISHFLEHMFFKGTKKHPSLQAIAEVLDKVGGVYNAFTAEDFTGFFAKTDFSNLDLALEWVSDILLNPLFREEDIEKEKGVILAEIKMYYDNPQSYVQILWPELLYGDQPAGWPIAGREETVSKISRADLISYFKNYYVTNNTLVCVSGNFNQKTIKKSIEKYFLKFPSGKASSKVPVIEQQKSPKVLLHYRETEQTHFCLGVRAFNLFHPLKYAQEIVGTILGGMFSSRISVLFREKLGMAYYVHTDVETNPDTGFLVTSAGVDAQHIEKAIRVILNEYKKMTQNKLDKKEIKKAKDYLKGKLAISLETSNSLASFYSLQELLQNKILTPEEVMKEIDKVTKNDILKVAKMIFRPEKLNLAIVGPFKDKGQFEKILKL